MERCYFDWAATAMPFAENKNPAHGTTPFANPSSIHTEGKAARAALEDARSRCAKTLGVKQEEIYFTSGGTESNAIVLFSLLAKPRSSLYNGDQTTNSKSAVFLYSAVEHPSIRENAAALEQAGIPCAPIAAEKDGRISETTLEKALEKNPRARMAAIMAVNNETGAINDIKVLSQLIRRKKKPIHIHCDIVQAAGKIPLCLHDWDVDSASISAHKLGAGHGIGILWLKAPLTPLLRGGGQEKNIRSGTENVAGAMDLALALERLSLEKTALHSDKKTLPYSEAAERMKTLIKKLQSAGLYIPIPPDRGEEDVRFSPWILQCAFKNTAGKIIPGEVMVRALDEKGFAVSTGSACSSGDTKRPVLEAMGLDKETGAGGIRISQGWSTTIKEINFLADTIIVLLNTL